MQKGSKKFGYLDRIAKGRKQRAEGRKERAIASDFEYFVRQEAEGRRRIAHCSSFMANLYSSFPIPHSLFPVPHFLLPIPHPKDPQKLHPRYLDD